MSGKEMTAYTDGSSHGNPGRAGIGVVLQDGSGKVIARLGEYIGRTTNNVAEYMAVICGMQEALLRGAQQLTIRTDSELVARQLTGVYRTKEENLKRLMKLVRHLERGFSEFRVEHIPREENREADGLAEHSVEEVE